MISKLKQKIDSLIGTASGYKGIIFINFCILVLVLGLMFVQFNWISKEKKTLEFMIDSQSEKSKVTETSLKKTFKKMMKETVAKKKKDGVSNKFLQEGKITKSNIANSIKKADMCFDYDQYEKAVVAYKRVVN